MDALSTLEQQFREADDLLCALAIAGERFLEASPLWDELSPDESIEVSRAFRAALWRTHGWVPQPSSRLHRLARYLAADAVAAHRLRDHLPEVADLLEQPWRHAVDVRGTLRLLGPEVEEVAARLAPSWMLPIRELPAAAAAVSATAPDRRGRTSR